MMVSNRNLLFQWLIFRFHVKLQGCNRYHFQQGPPNLPSTASTASEAARLGIQAADVASKVTEVGGRSCNVTVFPTPVGFLVTPKWMFPKIVGFLPKSSILIGFSIINHPFWGTPIFGNTQMVVKSKGISFPQKWPKHSEVFWPNFHAVHLMPIFMWC